MEVEGSQLTVVFHIDDLMISHKSASVVSQLIKKLNAEYGSRDPLTVTRGKLHEYLGMTIDFSIKGECAFSQYDYLKKLFDSILLVISMNGDGAVIYIDGAHAIHLDARGHSGLVLTQGKGAMISVSKKLGVVTTSSTEMEIVSTGERLPKCTWFRYFRLAQGESKAEDVLMQDNKSAIILQKNYPYSTRKGSKHIHIQYFFVVDKLDKKELRIVYCPTDQMIADYNSKPLQGQVFIDLRNKLLGIDAADYQLYKKHYKSILMQYDLFDTTENNLWDL